MNTFYRTFLLIVALFAPASNSFAQQSQYTVSYKVAYNASDQRYTVYVVPEYNVPNAVNTTQNEIGATASVTIAVPKDFSLVGNVTDIKGDWQQSIKLGPGQPNQDYTGYALDPNTNYYVIGKSANSTNYGTFTSGVPVALFSFAGNGCFGQIRVIEPNEPFIEAAFDKLSFNVANSFYSQSSNNIDEQFRAVSGPPASAVTFTAPADLCVGAGVQTGLGGGLPAGGVYSGPGVMDNGNGTTYSFDPAVAGVGTRTIAYTINTCSVSATDVVEVLALPQTVSISSPNSTNAGVTQAISSIFATNKILQPNGKAEYQAGNFISLQPGFEVERGAVFKALIQNPCSSF